MNLSGGDRHLITTGTGSGVTAPEVSPYGTEVDQINVVGEHVPGTWWGLRCVV